MLRRSSEDDLTAFAESIVLPTRSGREMAEAYYLERGAALLRQATVPVPMLVFVCDSSADDCRDDLAGELPTVEGRVVRF